jgi:hypothetical protein
MGQLDVYIANFATQVYRARGSVFATSRKTAISSEFEVTEMLPIFLTFPAALTKMITRRAF